jgi:SAM-dependent methyltransferase
VSDLAVYWHNRYLDGKGSGPSSRGDVAAAKADRINRLLDGTTRTVVDWGVGDGTVAAGIDANRYLGVDITQAALDLARAACGPRPGWSWLLYDPHLPPPLTVQADLALSLDVLFHLTDDQAYRTYLQLLFGSAPTVFIRASNYDAPRNDHMRRRRWLPDVPDGWQLNVRPATDEEEGWWLFRRR